MQEEQVHVLSSLQVALLLLATQCMCRKISKIAMSKALKQILPVLAHDCKRCYNLLN